MIIIIPQNSLTGANMRYDAVNFDKSILGLIRFSAVILFV